MIHLGNVVSITHEGLDEDLFNRNPIWCEYYLPSEINFLVEQGEDRSFLQKHLISDTYSRSKNKTYYSLSIDALASSGNRAPTFLHISSKFIIDSAEYSGYLWIVDGQITGVTVFHEGCQIDLSLSEDLSEENRFHFSKLSQGNIGSVAKISVTPTTKVFMLGDEFELCIPV